MIPPSPPESSRAAGDPDWVGRIIAGRFRVEAVLGVGGMGTAYRARDERTNRIVVLKVPHARHFSEGESRSRFQDEIRKLLEIEHPHIVKVFDVGDEDGTPFAVFPFLAGGSLSVRVKAADRQLPPDEVVPWLTQIAEALDDLHARGDIHRDVKPDNILFDKPLGKGKANAYLADFGLAKALGLDPSRMFQSLTGTLIGTQAYMAPEQFSRLAPVTGAVDQYALATTVYQAVSGRMPFAVSSSEELAVAKAIGAPRPLTEVAKHVPASTGRAVMRALSADPRARFASCADFARAFVVGVAHPPHVPYEVAPLSGPPEGRWMRGRRGRIAAVLAIVGGLGGVGSLFGWFRGGEVRPRTERTAEVPGTPASNAAAKPPAAAGPVVPAAVESPTAEPVPTVPTVMDVETASPGRGGDPAPATTDALPSTEPAMDAVPPPAPVIPAPAPAAAPLAPAPPSPPEWARVGADQIAEAKRLVIPVAFENSIGMRFVLVPVGTFAMGSPEGEKGRDSDETQHRVTLTQAFYVSIHETTNGQYRRFKPKHDSGRFTDASLNGDAQPVVSVTHTEAVEFAAWLSGQERGRRYGLPTETQWEYAARAKTTTSRYWGDDESGFVRNANIPDANAKARFGSSWSSEWDDGFGVTSPVRAFLPNEWGLYDVIGNVWEWCADWKADYPTGTVRDPTGPDSGTGRVLRGGSWYSNPDNARAAERNDFGPVAPSGLSFGFRLVSPAPASR